MAIFVHTPGADHDDREHAAMLASLTARSERVPRGQRPATWLDWCAPVVAAALSAGIARLAWLVITGR